MILSYAIASHNRRDTLLKTLRYLEDRTPFPRDRWEAWVVDNASTDGSADAVREYFPRVHLIENPRNDGPVAKNLAFDRAAGCYWVILDDDSYPLGDAVSRAVDHLERRPGVGAVVGRCELPDGRCEAPALPGVLMGGAAVLRASVVRDVGGFPMEFFKGAEEYDLSFRIWDAGHRIDRLEDVVFRHDKVETNRPAGLLDFTDLRNNLILVERFLPREMRSVYRRDWLRRYRALSKADPGAIGSAIAEARQWAQRERAVGRRVLSEAVLESIFEWRRQEGCVSGWARTHGVRRVVIDGYSKNIFATFRACRIAGLEIQSIVDDATPFIGECYRGVEVVERDAVQWRAIEGAVLSNINPAQIDRSEALTRGCFDGPVLRLWNGRRSDDPVQTPASVRLISVNAGAMGEAGRGVTRA